MKGISFSSLASRLLHVPYDRSIKHATALRQMGLYPDGRATGDKAHVSTLQAAHLIVMYAANPQPTDHASVLKYLEMTDFILELADLLQDGGEKIFSQGVRRVSISLDRPFATIVYTDPLKARILEEHGTQNLSIRETEQCFGDEGARSFERFAFVKRSALTELAMAIQQIPVIN